jgi:hypothetical protein
MMVWRPETERGAWVVRCSQRPGRKIIFQLTTLFGCVRVSGNE